MMSHIKNMKRELVRDWEESKLQSTAAYTAIMYLLEQSDSERQCKIDECAEGNLSSKLTRGQRVSMIRALRWALVFAGDYNQVIETAIRRLESGGEL